MADIEITVEGGTSKRLLTAGKYCDRNITVTATGGGGEPEPPDDGKTRLYITVPANSMPDRPPPRNEVPLYIQQSVDNGVTIDWGDGSDPETLPGTGNVNTTHTYQQAGDYVISLDPADGCELGLGWGDIDYCVMGSLSDMYNVIYICMLKHCVVGRIGVSSIGDYAFQYCSALSSVTIPNGVTSIGKHTFDSCYNLSSIIIPSGVTSIGDYAFRSCSVLSSVTIQDSVTSIRKYSFNLCYTLSSIIIPSGVTSIGDSAFGGCYGLKEYHFLSKTPPTLTKSDAFINIPPDCIIYVPVGSLEAYQTAANWSTYAGQMREEGA